MKGVFADTAYWIAISNPHDFLHDRARQISRSLPSKRLVTSEMVFTELLNDFGQRSCADLQPDWSSAQQLTVTSPSSVKRAVNSALRSRSIPKDPIRIGA